MTAPACGLCYDRGPDVAAQADAWSARMILRDVDHLARTFGFTTVPWAELEPVLRRLRAHLDEHRSDALADMYSAATADGQAGTRPPVGEASAVAAAKPHPHRATHPHGDHWLCGCGKRMDRHATPGADCG